MDSEALDSISNKLDVLIKYSGPKNLDTKTGRAKVHSAHEKRDCSHSLST